MHEEMCSRGRGGSFLHSFTVAKKLSGRPDGKCRLSRPFALWPPIGGYDVQGAVPAGWCSRCGKELFGYRARCRLCEEEEKWKTEA